MPRGSKINWNNKCLCTNGKNSTHEINSYTIAKCGHISVENEMQQIKKPSRNNCANFIAGGCGKVVDRNNLLYTVIYTKIIFYT